jgi:CelD/BcsL family acetyltransferase involved in cellulose biosynthesis
LRGWRFSRAPIEQHLLDPYRYQGSYHRDEIRFADLREGYDGYVKTLPEGVTRRIARTERYRRALQREVGEVSFEWNSGDTALLSLLFKWKSDQFDSARTWLSDPSTRTWIQTLADSDQVDCAGITSALYAGTKPLAILFSLRHDHILAAWIVAYDTEYSRFSPGTILWLTLFQEAAKREVKMVDFGYGDNRYKQWFGNAAYGITGGGVWASRLGATARSVYRRARYSHEAH